jgi:thiosulfate/3-mercaptopyruvate sulfurtransferase
LTGASEVPALVDPDWALAHLDDPGVRFVDVEFDRTQFDAGHLPGAVCWTWAEDLIDPVRRDLIDGEALAALLERSGIGAETHVVLYGDDDWYAAWALWQLRLAGLRRLSLLDGGRGHWQAQRLPTEAGPDANGDVPAVGAGPGRVARRPNGAHLRIDHGELLARHRDGLVVVDVRLDEEYRGEVTAPAGYSAIAQRAGHIPGARWAPWEASLGPDGRFLPATELRERFAGRGIDGSREIVTYCGVGVRSAHSWFVLHELLGYDARNYDGGWAEWGSVVGAPIETGPDPSA